MRWNPDEHYKDLRKTAKGVLFETLHGPVPMQTTAALAQGVLDLIERIKKDEVAISATLEECDGHLTLASMVIHYRSHKEGWERMRKAEAVARQAIDDHNNEAPINQTIAALARISGERDL